MRCGNFSRDIPGTRLVEVGSVAPDPSRYGIGSSFYPGDISNALIPIPAAPTPLASDRYLFRLAAYTIPPCERAWIVGIRQALLIGEDYEVEDQNQMLKYPVERMVDDPFWSFVDGNVSWHLTYFSPADRQDINFPSPSVAYPYATEDYFGVQPGLLVESGSLLPPNKGYAPGKPIEGFGTFYDLRFPWREWGWMDVGLQVDGPLTVGLFASVRQTDPDTRLVLPNAPEGPTDTCLRCEDVFVRNNPETVYRRIGGALAILIPDLPGNGCAHKP